MGPHFTGDGSRRKLLRNAILAVALTGEVWVPLWSAQSPRSDWQTAAGGKMAFDVASVTPNTTGPAYGMNSDFPLGPGDVYVATGGRFRATNFSLLAYIEFAYKIDGNQDQSLVPQLPKWVTTAHFDIQAKAQGNPTKDQMRLMMQSLLADRFRLVVHYETRQVPVFALLLDVPGKLGPLLQQHADDSPCPTTFRVPSPAPTAPPQTLDTRFPATCGGIVGMVPSAPGRKRGGARNVSMDLIASSLAGGSDGVGRPILDRTGLTGMFDFAIEFVPRFNGSSTPPGNFQPDPTGPTFMEAIKEQLGLKLESQTGPVDVLVIDNVEEASAN
jgi:uncharacterized protein (TIGR03435 family)